MKSFLAASSIRFLFFSIALGLSFGITPIKTNVRILFKCGQVSRLKVKIRDPKRSESSRYRVARIDNLEGASMKLNAKYVTFSAIALASTYVLYHNERFLIDGSHPAWQHYAPFKWWLLPHGIFGAIVL